MSQDKFYHKLVNMTWKGVGRGPGNWEIGKEELRKIQSEMIREVISEIKQTQCQ